MSLRVYRLLMALVGVVYLLSIGVQVLGCRHRGGVSVVGVFQTVCVARGVVW